MRVIAINNGRTEIIDNVDSIGSEGGGDLRIDSMGGITPDMLVVLPDE